MHVCVDPGLQESGQPGVIFFLAESALPVLDPLFWRGNPTGPDS